jgi:hypothetical protein
MPKTATTSHPMNQAPSSVTLGRTIDGVSKQLIKMTATHRLIHTFATISRIST